jgi:DNA-binding LytR/AlgR family response regulator
MRIAVCDDNRQDACALRALLEGQEVKLYGDAESLLADVRQGSAHYDLYLLDIFMENSMSGLELARELRATDETAVLCFVSTSDDFYREAYDLYAIQYLIKPVSREAVRRLLDKVEQIFLKDAEKTLPYSWRRSSGTIPYGKILYISSREHVLSIRCTDGRVQESTGKLNDMERQICGDTFLRCHQSFIVNIYHVEGMSGLDLTVAGERIPVSRRYYTEVRKRYQQILFEGVDL